MIKGFSFISLFRPPPYPLPPHPPSLARDGRELTMKHKLTSNLFLP